MSSKKFLARDRLRASCQKVKGSFFRHVLSLSVIPTQSFFVLFPRYCEKISGMTGLLEYLQLLSGQDQVH